jgi:hypothetical protein
MSKADEPAFPISISNDPEDYVAFPGLTKREYFAGLALQGFLAFDCNSPPREAASEAVNYADELLAALERKPE